MSTLQERMASVETALAGVVKAVDATAADVKRISDYVIEERVRRASAARLRRAVGVWITSAATIGGAIYSIFSGTLAKIFT